MATTAKPYIPTFLKHALSSSKPLELTFSQVKDTNIASTSSFIYDAPKSPLKTSQQLNVDWSKFENHTFYMSAEAKTNIAFEEIINGYPFDGTRAETERFFEKLTGFDKWVFEQFPKYRGQLHFSGTQVGEDTDGKLGTWIQVKDYTGALFPELAKTNAGMSVLNPKNSTSMTIEAQVFVPSGSTSGNQVLLQKMSGSSEGFALYLEATGSTTLASAKFSIFSGTISNTTSTELEKGTFNHIAVILNRDNGPDSLQFYKNGEIVSTSRFKNNIGNMNIDAADLYIGSGSAFVLGTTTVTPTQTFSGSLDELRIYHAARSVEQLQQYSRRSVFSTPELKLYYRFNEPAPPLVASSTDAINGIVIDSSGNSLHALITNFTGSLRQDASTDATSRMAYEQTSTAPVLFPGYADVVTLNTTLLTSASAYDLENPNLITKLVPSHYLLEGAAFEGMPEIQGTSNDSYSYVGSGVPGQGDAGQTQMMLTLLYIYARFLDEIKLFIDSFSSLRYVDYNKYDTVPDNFILTLVQEYGFDLPPMFNDSTIEQYIRAENIDRDDSVSTYPLRYVQNELMRRILINIPDVIKSKGTLHAIQSFLRAVGIDPNNSMRLREYGGPTIRQLSYARENKRDVNLMLQVATGSLTISPYLSASRTEKGFPEAAGTFVQTSDYPPSGISDEPSDGLLTSGSWTFESIVKWTPTLVSQMTSTTQSLARFNVTGSSSSEGGIVANLLAMSSSIDPKVMLYVRPGSDDTSSPMLSMSIYMPTKGVFDGDKWNVSFGVNRNDEVGSFVSSSYFLRVAKQNGGNVESYAASSSFFYELAGVSGETNAFRTFNTASNASGSYISLGSGQQVLSGTSGYLFLNNTAVAPSEARETTMNGLVSNVRFWSRGLTEQEWKEHVRNYKSTGVHDPLVNYNYVTTRTGSFERLRLNAVTKQDARYAESTSSVGSITFLDFSENGMHLTGTNFPIETELLKAEIFDYSYLSPNFDEASTTDKIRARSFQNYDLVSETPWAATAPVHEIVKSEEPTDDVRFSIEFSLIDALNRDIMTLFATLDAFDNALGSPELVFSPDYPQIENLRDVYFNRIKDKVNFKLFFEFFRWFDTSIGTFIEQLVPRKTNFKGTNFVVESHVLERHKLEYQGNEMYLGESDRNRIRDVLLLQNIVGKVRKY